MYRGDVNFTEPNAENAEFYETLSRVFLKTDFDAEEFLRCGEQSKRFPIEETEADTTQSALAEHGVNLQCLACIQNGCGYCFVENNLEDGPEVLTPALPPFPRVRVSARSQCLYDPDGSLCAARLTTDACRHKVPSLYTEIEQCYGSRGSALLSLWAAECRHRMSSSLLLPPADSVPVQASLRIESLGEISASFNTFHAVTRPKPKTSTPSLHQHSPPALKATPRP